MHQQSKISFTTTPSKTRLNEGQIYYQGQLRHNQVMNVEETRRLFVIVCRKLNQTEGTDFLQPGSADRSGEAPRHRLLPRLSKPPSNPRQRSRPDMHEAG